MKYLFLILLFLAMQTAFAQNPTTTLSGRLQDKTTKEPLPFVSVVLKNAKDSILVTGTISNEKGLFSLKDLKQGEYIMEVSYFGYQTLQQAIFVGKLNNFLDLGTIELTQNIEVLQEIVIEGKRNEVVETLDKKIFKIDENLSQGGGSVLQAMKNLPSVTISQDGKVALRGNDKVTVLIDGKQTALTGFGNQAGLDNIPASAIERIEVINNPSAKNDANGSAGIINIIFKKSQQEGLNGKVGLISGIGALWQKQANLPTIPPAISGQLQSQPFACFELQKKESQFVFSR